jgi:hypothetical protein
MELIAKQELVETPAAHIEASRTEQRRYCSCARWIAAFTAWCKWTEFLKYFSQVESTYSPPKPIKNLR